MPPPELTVDGVLSAIAAYDAEGRLTFIKNRKLPRTKTLFVDLDGRLYDTKALVASILGPLGVPVPLDRETAATWLAELGFQIRDIPVPVWKKEEIILACELVKANGGRPLDHHDPRVVALSQLLQSGQWYPHDKRGPDFRNPAGVARKTANIAASRSAQRTNDNRLDGEVFDEFEADPVGMLARAAGIRALLVAREAVETAQDQHGPTVRDVAVEASHTSTFTSAGREAIIAERRESLLVQRYRAWVAEQGGDLTSKEISLSGQSKPLKIDLYHVQDQELIEAKGTVARDSIRLALGQLLDYGRHISHQAKAVLLPAHPGEDLISYLHDHQTSCIYEVPGSGFERV